jgi:hypothetical protein
MMAILNTRVATALLFGSSASFAVAHFATRHFRPTSIAIEQQLATLQSEGREVPVIEDGSVAALRASLPAIRAKAMTKVQWEAWQKRLVGGWRVKETPGVTVDGITLHHFSLEWTAAKESEWQQVTAALKNASREPALRFTGVRIGPTLQSAPALVTVSGRVCLRE